MSVFRSRPAVRWLVPAAAAAVVIGGGAAAGTIVASADPSLPPRSAAQLLVDLQTARVAGLSGTIVETADLGLPSVPGLTGGQGGDVDLTKLITGSNTARVWYAGQDKVRVSLMGVMGETDLVRNGTDVWLWRSTDNTARHMTIPAGEPDRAPTALPSGIPVTPQEAADQALAAIDPTTNVTTTGAAKVAGRDAYELVLAPKDTASLIGQVRLAVDAKQHIPLRVDVYAKGANNPAVRVAFQQISFTVPDAQQFVFNPPPGTKVTNEKSPEGAAGTPAPRKDMAQTVPGKPVKPSGAEHGDSGSTVVGTGWTSVLVAKVPSDAASGTSGAQNPVAGIVNSLPKVSGSWGSGRLLSSSLFTALLTDDGRLLAGAVSPDRLYQVAATNAGK